MRFLTGTLILAGILSAQNYQSVASNAHLMKGITKPSMDALAAMSKAGGPKDDAEWAQAEQAAALVAESTQILLMGDRPKDQDVWIKSANRVIAGAKASAAAAKEKNLEAWKPTLGQMGGGCRGCHDVHRPKK